MLRRTVLMPLILLYMLALPLAAWQSEFRPAVFHGAHRLAFDALGTVGIRAGMRVFGGPAEPLEALVRARCTLVDGIDADGRRTRIYPTGPCPAKGLRWKPSVYEHMIVHWTAMSRTGLSDNLTALGDHFCQLSKSEAFTHVEIQLQLALIDYATGRKWNQSKRMGRVECR